MSKNVTSKVKVMTVAALLSAIGILIPMVMPKIIVEPASYTLASHVPVFIAMFISPAVTISVAIISSIGFLFAGFPMVIVLRALTHLIFATTGALILKKRNNLLASSKTAIPFGLLLAVIHAIAEVTAVCFYYFGTGTSTSLYFIFVLVGLGTIIHSMVDFGIAVFVWIPLQHVVMIPANAKIKRVNKSAA